MMVLKSPCHGCEHEQKSKAWDEPCKSCKKPSAYDEFIRSDGIPDVYGDTEFLRDVYDPA